MAGAGLCHEIVQALQTTTLTSQGACPPKVADEQVQVHCSQGTSTAHVSGQPMYPVRHSIFRKGWRFRKVWRRWYAAAAAAAAEEEEAERVIGRR